MTTGSVLGTANLLIVATAPNLPLFFTGWTLAGLAMASTSCQPAFAALTRWHTPDHVRTLTDVTLAGGLASTVFAPLTALLAAHLSGRTTYLILATAFTLSAFAMYAAVVALVPLLLERGCTTSQAAWALGIGGAGQTLGRTLYAALARRTTATTRTTALVALGGLTTSAFAITPGPYALLVGLSIAGRHGARQPHPSSKPPPSPTAGGSPRGRCRARVQGDRVAGREAPRHRASGRAQLLDVCGRWAVYVPGSA
jgi:hypothetical protein